MVEKVSKIARVKPIDYDVERRFDSQNQRDDKKGSFLYELRQVLNKKSPPSEFPAAYNLELSGEHLGLFYYGGLDLNALLR